MRDTGYLDSNALNAAGAAPDAGAASLPWAQGTLPSASHNRSQAEANAALDFSSVLRRPSHSSVSFPASAWQDPAGGVEIPGIASGGGSAPRVRRRFESGPPSSAMPYQRSGPASDQHLDPGSQADTSLPPGFDRENLGGDLGVGQALQRSGAMETYQSQGQARPQQQNGLHTGASSRWQSLSPTEAAVAAEGGSPHNGWRVGPTCHLCCFCLTL